MLLLAAGQSRRFGADKRLAKLPRGNTLLSASIQCYLHLGWPLYIVLRPNEQDVQEQTERALTQTSDTQSDTSTRYWVTADDAHQGMGHSLSAGASVLVRAGCNQALIGLGDMPYLSADTVTRCATALEQRSSSATDAIIRPRYQNRPGNPVGFSGIHLRHLQKASGDTGAKPLLQANAQVIDWLDVNDPGILNDIDKPSDLQL